MKTNHEIKFFLTLVLSTFFLLGFSHFGNMVYEAAIKSENGYANGTKIGNIDISGFSEKKATEKVTRTVQKWQDSTSIEIHLSELVKQIDNRMFQFDIQKSMDLAISGQSNQLYVTLNNDIFQNDLQTIHSSALHELKQEQLKKDFIYMACNLNTDSVIFNLYSYLPDAEKKEIVLTESKFTNIAKYPDLLKWVNTVKEIHVHKQQIVSMASFFKDKAPMLTTQSQNIIASSLYKAILPTNFEIDERHIGLMLPNEIDLGYEAKIVPGDMDFVFRNANDVDYTLSFKIANGNLIVSLIGLPFYYDYQIQTMGFETFKPRTVIQYSKSIEPGQKQTKEKGRNGFEIKVYRETYDSQKLLVDSKLISEDYYAPVHQVIIVNNQNEPNQGAEK